MADGFVTLDYQTLVRELFPRLTGGIRWGLERTTNILADAGDPHRQYPVLHVGGTNGKGTTCALAESVLRAAGLRTGLYTSPHLTSFRERIRIDGIPIDEAALLDSANRLWPSIEREAPSFFEATTAIAFDVVARAGVDVAVVEVGLGGRLDSTNVVTPEVAVVTRIGVDHVEYLGSDPKGIALEKAGIAKSGVPFLTGEPDDELFAVMARHAESVGAPVVRLPVDEPAIEEAGTGHASMRLTTERWGPLAAALRMTGAHQARNAALAVRAIELTALAPRVGREDVLRGVQALEPALWPGRFQVVTARDNAIRVPHGDATWVFDVAHNPQAIERLALTIAEASLPRPLTLLLGVMGDKDWRAIMASLATVADRIVVTRPAHAPPGRAWDPAEALAFAETAGLATSIMPDLRAAALALAAEASGTVLVTGSFHTVGEALIALGIDLGWEPDPLV